MRLVPTGIECFANDDINDISESNQLFEMKLFDDVACSFKSDCVLCHSELDDFCDKIKESYFQLFPEHLEDYNKLKEEQ